MVGWFPYPVEQVKYRESGVNNEVVLERGFISMYACLPACALMCMHSSPFPNPLRISLNDFLHANLQTVLDNIRSDCTKNKRYKRTRRTVSILGLNINIIDKPICKYPNNPNIMRPYGLVGDTGMLSQFSGLRGIQVYDPWIRSLRLNHHTTTIGSGRISINWR